MSKSPSIKSVFGRVVSISLAKRSDRRREQLRNLKQIKWPFRPVEYFNACTPKEFPAPANWRELPNAFACKQSHYCEAVAAQRLHAKGKLTLVLEDDCRFTPDFVLRFKQFMSEVPDNWDALLFGYESSGIQPIQITPHVGLARHFFGLHCYCVREPMLTEWTRRLRDAKMAADWVMCSLMTEYNVYVPLPSPLAYQQEGVSDVTGETRWRDEHGRLNKKSVDKPAKAKHTTP